MIQRIAWALVLVLMTVTLIAPGMAQNFGNIPPETMLANPSPSAKQPAQPTPFAAIDVRAYGASPANADNTAQIQAAINANVNTGNTLVIAGGVYKVTSLTSAGKLRILQVPDGSGTGLAPTRACTTGLREITPNVTTLTVTGDGVTLQGLCIDNSTISNASGVGISLGVGSHMVVQDVQIAGACIPLDLTGGDSAHQNLTTLVERSVFMPANAAGCIGVRVGQLSTNAATTDVHFSNNAIYCFPAPTYPNPPDLAEGLVIRDVGGFFGSQNDVVGCIHGMHIVPTLAGQSVTDVEVNGGVVGDTDSQESLLIDTGGPNTTVELLSFVGFWIAPYPKYSYPAIGIHNNGGGYVGSVHFVGGRILAPEAFDGIQLFAGQDVVFDGNIICNRATSSSESLLYVDGANRVSVHDNTFGPCDVTTNSVVIAEGVNFGSNFGFVQITGNSFTGVTEPVKNPTPSAITGTLMVSNNLGIEEVYSSVASASSIVVPVNPTFFITGTTSINNMVWSGGSTTRTILPGSSFSWGSTGNVCGAVSPVAAGLPLLAVYDGTCWYIK